MRGEQGERGCPPKSAGHIRKILKNLRLCVPEAPPGPYRDGRRPAIERPVLVRKKAVAAKEITITSSPPAADPFQAAACVITCCAIFLGLNGAAGLAAMLRDGGAIEWAVLLVASTFAATATSATALFDFLRTRATIRAN